MLVVVIMIIIIIVMIVIQVTKTITLSMFDYRFTDCSFRRILDCIKTDLARGVKFDACFIN